MTEFHKSLIAANLSVRRRKLYELLSPERMQRCKDLNLFLLIDSLKRGCTYSLSQKLNNGLSLPFNTSRSMHRPKNPFYSSFEKENVLFLAVVL